MSPSATTSLGRDKGLVGDSLPGMKGREKPCCQYPSSQPCLLRCVHLHLNAPHPQPGAFCPGEALPLGLSLPLGRRRDGHSSCQTWGQQELWSCWVGALAALQQRRGKMFLTAVKGDFKIPSCLPGVQSTSKGTEAL